MATNNAESRQQRMIRNNTSRRRLATRRAFAASGVQATAREHDDGLSAFAPVRSRLFGIAYRMLGSAAEADDIVQDVWLRWQSTNRSVVQDPPAFLATTTTRLCINLAQSARSRRETYVGEWLPEPADTTADPTLGAERGEALKLAVLVLLEKLSPTERAAYVLREAFDYSYRHIADILRMVEANVRQLVSRARKHIANGRRTSVSSGQQRRLLEAFIGAAQNGDMAALESLLVNGDCIASENLNMSTTNSTLFYPLTIASAPQASNPTEIKAKYYPLTATTLDSIFEHGRPQE